MPSLACCILAALSAAALALYSGTAEAAGAAACDAYAREAVAKAQGMRDFACGYDAGDPRWTTDRNGHARWCRATPADAVALETARRRGEIKLCRLCRGYANAAVTAAAGNVKLKCGFDGPRWHDRAADHFAWCMALRDGGGAATADISGWYAGLATKMQTSMNPETGHRIHDIEQCRLRQRGPRRLPPRS